MKTISETLRELRESKGLLLRQVAAANQIDPALLSRIETGSRKATKVQIIKLAKFYKVDEKILLVPFLSDKIVSEVQHETHANEALKLAERQLEYNQSQKGKLKRS